MDNRLVCICGPTASGKTALSVALAKKLHTEIISADSMQLYRYMDIGTAKPTIEERQGIRHHLFDVCEPGEAFSVARYVELADAAAQDILSRNMIPVVVGHGALYGCADRVQHLFGRRDRSLCSKKIRNHGS